MNKSLLLRKIYLYLFSVVGLMLVIIGSVRLVTLALKAYIFTEADKYYEYPPLSRPQEPPIAEKPGPTVEPKEFEEHWLKRQRSDRQREAAGSIAQLIVGLPLYLYHWRVIQKEKDKDA